MKALNNNFKKITLNKLIDYRKFKFYDKPNFKISDNFILNSKINIK